MAINIRGAFVAPAYDSGLGYHYPGKRGGGRENGAPSSSSSSSSAPWVLISCDYSQIELRILAHLSQDPNLIRILRQQAGAEGGAEGGDVFNMIAASILGKNPGSIAKGEREIAKRVTYGMVYGRSRVHLYRRGIGFI